MQQLHLVGFTTDIEGLIFSSRRGSRSGGYMVVLDDRLLERIEDALRLRNEQDPDSADPPVSRRPLRAASNGTRPRRSPTTASVAPADDPGSNGDADGPDGHDNGSGQGHRESTLTVREMQARLRAGFSIIEVAAEAGVDEEWVARFAAPILAEQEQVIERAQQLVYVAPRKGESSLPLGLAVQMATRDKGVLLDDDRYADAWTAYQLHDSRWVVRFTYVSRKRIQHADWEVDTRVGSLAALNRAAGELGFVEKARRRAGLAMAEATPSVGVVAGGMPDHDRTVTPLATRRSVTKRKRARPAKGAGSASARNTRPVAKGGPAKKRVSSHQATAEAPARPVAQTRKPRRPKIATPAAAPAGPASAAPAPPVPVHAPAVDSEAVESRAARAAVLLVDAPATTVANAATLDVPTAAPPEAPARPRPSRARKTTAATATARKTATSKKASTRAATVKKASKKASASKTAKAARPVAKRPSRARRPEPSRSRSAAKKSVARVRRQRGSATPAIRKTPTKQPAVAPPQRQPIAVATRRRPAKAVAKPGRTAKAGRVVAKAARPKAVPPRRSK